MTINYVDRQVQEPGMDLDSLMSFMIPEAKPPRTVLSIDEDNIEDGDLFVARDGIYEFKKKVIGNFWSLKEKFKDPIPLMPEIDAKFISNPDLPKIPGYLFQGIIRFYRNIYKTNKNEVMAQIWWDRSKQEYLVEVPVQRVSGASISYDKEGVFYTNPDLTCVLTSHSHHTMGAFYSGTDNTDEKGRDGQYSFVFGGLKENGDGTFNYTTVQRVCYKDTFINLNIDDIFDFSAEGHYEVPEELYLNITERAPTVVTTTKSYPMGNYYTGASSIASSKAKPWTNTGSGGYPYYDDYFDYYNAYYPVGNGRDYSSNYGGGKYSTNTAIDLGLIFTKIEDVAADINVKYPGLNLKTTDVEIVQPFFQKAFEHSHSDVTTEPVWEPNKVEEHIAKAFENFQYALGKYTNMDNFIINEAIPHMFEGLLNYFTKNEAPSFSLEEEFSEDSSGQYDATIEYLSGAGLYAMHHAFANIYADTNLINPIDEGIPTIEESAKSMFWNS